MKKGLLKGISFIGFVGISFVFGHHLGALLAKMLVISLWENELLDFLYLGSILVVGFVLMWLLAVILHELGHLLGGLLSGYRFISFRVGSRVLVRWDEGLVWKRFSLVGTGGQCLMAPPVSEDYQVPVLLINLGGPLMNLLWASLWPLSLALKPSLGSLLLFLFGVLNLLLFLMTIFPVKGKVVANDGWNAWELSRNQAAREALAKQLLIVEAMTRGQKARSLPEDWFQVAAKSPIDDSFSASLEFYRAMQLMDKKDYQAGSLVMQELLESDRPLPGVHRIMLRLVRLYYNLLTESKEADLSLLEEKEIQQFLKAMKDYPLVLTLNYALARLSKQDQAEAARIRQRLDRVLATYPTKAEIDSVREDLELIDRIAAGQPLD